MAATLAAIAAPASAAPAGMAPTISTSSTQRSVAQMLVHAARTEASAALQYNAYGAASAASGQPALARVMRVIGDTEYHDHWAREVSMANLYSSSDNVANLRSAVTLAQQAARANDALAMRAPRGSTAQRALLAVADRQRADVRLLTKALAALQGRGTVPAAPRVRAVPTGVASSAHYTGALYSDLTNDATSALARSAWNWAAYQWFAHIAGDTGQARLTALLSGLADQERYLNWAELSNAAGYVHGNAANLRTLVGAEQGATRMSAEYAARAGRAGNRVVAEALRDIGRDELGAPAVLHARPPGPSRSRHLTRTARRHVDG
jgi:rubrerythrin